LTIADLEVYQHYDAIPLKETTLAKGIYRNTKNTKGSLGIENVIAKFPLFIIC